MAPVGTALPLPATIVTNELTLNREGSRFPGPARRDEDLLAADSGDSAGQPLVRAGHHEHAVTYGEISSHA